MKRLTIDMNNETHSALKSEVPKEGKTMREVVLELILNWLKERGYEPEHKTETA